jgi:eukaryotic-like serine/threonine-protein kinase
MALDTQSSGILRFGTFEVDLRAGELRKQGKHIKVQEQPFHVLTVLLQRPGEVVTREELRNQNWPPDTFVDFDNSLNTAINKLREALGDSADNPRFIETLPRRGYRFLVPVEGERKKEPAASRSRSTALIFSVVALASAAVVGVWFWQGKWGHVLTEQDTIVLGDFANSTGDPVFDGTLREGLSVQLEQSPFLSLVSEEGIHQTLRMMGQPANARLTPDITREVCQRTSSTTALDGSIALIGTRYNLILKAVNCASGDLLASTEAQADDKSHVLDALGKVASEMRTKLGESLSTVKKYNTPLEEATTPSLEALQAYSLGWRTLNEGGDFAASLPFWQRAVQFDPNFAMAYWAMSGPYADTGDLALPMENIRKAFELRMRVSERERLVIEIEYFWDISGNLIQVQHICEVGAQTYPREPIFHVNLGLIANFLGQYDAGLTEYQQALRLAPYNSFFHRNVAYTYLSLNRVEESAAAAKGAHIQGLGLAPVLYGIAFYRNDPAEMARQVAAAAGKPADEDLLLALQADTAAYFGELRKAREFSRRAADSAKRAGLKGAVADYHAVSALREALFGDAANAWQPFAPVKGPSTGTAREEAVDAHDAFGLALALAYAGDSKPAQALIEDWTMKLPDVTVVRFNYIPTLRAKLALNRSGPQEALEILRAAAPYELGSPGIGFYNWPNLYPVYVRGEAYLAARQGREAAAEFQKILDHRGIVLNEPIGALAHLQLGRAYVISGDTAKARRAYVDFLTLWKDADPDIPILREAKAEYAKLR